MQRLVPAAPTDPAQLYLDLLKRALLNEFGLENELRLDYAIDCAARGQLPDAAILRDIRFHQAEGFAALAEARRLGKLNPTTRRVGDAYTLIGRTRLDQLHHCLDTVHRNGIPGVFLEAGVWRGGAGIFMRGFMAAHGIADRRVWLADSFRGLPPPSHPADQGITLHEQPSLAISADLVRDAFERFGLWDDHVRLVEGWFADTLPSLPVASLAILRLDGDLFTSTLETLVPLYPRLSPGGFVIIDDYFSFPGCRAAVESYRLRYGIRSPVVRIDWTGAFWQKETDLP